MSHPDPDTLLRLTDEDLSPAESSVMEDHLRGCGDCRDRLQALREALDDYVRFHREILKPSLPPPPRQWAPIQFPKAKVVHFPSAGWLAAAAAIAALVLLVVRFARAPEVRAAEILRKATAAEQAMPPSRARIRIRSRSRALDRPARLHGNPAGAETRDAAALRAMFDAAGYGWDDPLSAATFSRWRDTLPEKRDRIDENAEVFLIETSTPAGPLSDATLTLRRRDLHAVACTLRLRSGGDVIEMTELSGVTEPIPAPPQARPAVAVEPSAPAKPATLGDELEVIAALHRIGADLGEPLEVERSGEGILVRVSGVDERRRDRIRVALSGIPTAQLQYEEVRRNAPRAALHPSAPDAQTERVNPLIADLQAHLGNEASAADLSDELIEATDQAEQRAFALRSLARRFPPEAVSTLSLSDAGILTGIVRDHVGALAAAIQEIRRLLAPILPDVAAPAGPFSAARWQTTAESLPAAVEALDRVVNNAGMVNNATGDPRDIERRVAEATAKLGQEAAALQSTVRP
jgi:hypothetical protein